MNNEFNWFGIDFGTTNSAAFSFTGTNKDNIQPISYGDDEGRPLPSIVAINRETGKIITGREAKDKKNTLINTHEYFSSIKSIIDSNKTWTIAGKEWTPEDITSEIFKSLKKRIEKKNNYIESAVIAVPVGFSSNKKMHLRNAAKKAGIDVKMFMSEPTAAFCSNYNQLKGFKHVAVFDWGGGTLDVVVLKTENGIVQELSSEGMNFGGNDIDIIIAEKMHAKYMQKSTYPSISFAELDAVTKDQLLTKCEKAKCDFEDDDIVTITINKYGDYGSVMETISYDYFALLLEKNIEDAVYCLDKAIKKAGLNIASLDCILCVGGSSKLRPIREKLNQVYGENVIYYPEMVMWDIAKGAAITATRPGYYTLNKSIGILLSDENYLPLLERGQQIPCQEVNLTLGVVEGAFGAEKEARFVFTDSEYPTEREFTENFILPLRGFADEKIDLSCYIDQDFVFKLKVGTNRILESSYKTWNYDKLKISYRIEGN